MDLRDIKEFFLDISKYVIVAFVIFFILLYVATIQEVMGPSMQTTLMENDVLILNKFYYRFFPVKRNDVISFEYADTKYLIKRVIGLPGESIEYKDNLLYINDKAYEETSIESKTADFAVKDLGYEVIPEDMYLVLGDNREDSMDSRDFGLIKKEEIIGKVWLRVWPLNTFKIIK